MKNVFSLFCVMSLCLFSCKEKLVADFEYDCSGGACLAPIIINFSLNSENAESIQWDFGDGVTSTKPSETHEYSQPGIYPVTLTVFNGDDSKQITKDVEVGGPASRMLVKELKVLSFAEKMSNGSGWDANEGGTDSFADLYVTFAGNNIDNLPNLRDASLPNVQTGQLPVGFTFSPAVDLGDMSEVYRIILKDRDAQGDPIVGYVDMAPSEFINRKYYPAEFEVNATPTRFKLFVEWR